MKPGTLVVAAIALFWAHAAVADLSSGRAACERGDYTEARKLLSGPALAGDAEALMMLARIAHEGWAGKVDEVEAYVHLTRIVMGDSQELMDAAVAARQQVAADMSRADIHAAEDRLASLVEQRMGQAGLAAELSQAITALDDCPERCVGEAVRLQALGPAARPAIPALEAAMTRDSYWLSRPSYVNALYTIGTAAVPALCRIAEDKSKFAREGPWNMIQVGLAFTALGNVGADGRACLIRAIDGLPGHEGTFHEQHGMELDVGAMLTEAEQILATALIAVGDPDRTSHAAVRAAFDAAAGSKAVALSAVLAPSYGELQPAQDVLVSGSREAKLTLLELLAGLSRDPSFAGVAAPIRPLLTGPAKHPDPAIGELAASILERMAAPEPP